MLFLLYLLKLPLSNPTRNQQRLKDVIARDVTGAVGVNILSKRENNYDALVKNDELSSILPILISAISAALPEIIKIVSGLLGNSSTASSTGSLNEQDVIGDIVDEVKKVLPQAISSVQQNAGNTKRDTTTELIQAIIQEGVKLTLKLSLSFKNCSSSY